MKTGVVFFALFSLCLLGLSGCGTEPPEQIKKKFDVIVRDDFRNIVKDLSAASLADSVHFSVVEYKAFDKGAFRVKAVVDFFYLKGVRVKRTVKYRYVKSARQWERYANEYVHY